MSIRARWILIWIVSTLPLLGWWATGLFDLDEGFYAAVVGEMNRWGEWITPRYNGQPWFEKPILLYWLAKPMVALFGPDFGARLPSVLSALATYALVAWFCKRRFSDVTAQLAVLILAGSLLFVAIGRMMMTDMPLVLSLTAAMFFSWEARTDKGFAPGIGFALGVAVLAKGPVAIILFCLVWGWMLAWHRPRSVAFGPLVVAVLCMLVVVGTWYVPAYLLNGQTFVQKFLIEQNIGRFTGGDAAHSIGGPLTWVFYFPFLLLGMLPWSLWFPSALLKRREAQDPELGSFLASWAVIVFLFFTISGAKLPHYILPILPPLAILVALRLKEKSVHYAGAWCIAIAFVANAGFLVWYDQSGQAEAHRLAGYIRTHASGNVALYQLGRRQASRGTGGTKLQETSLPSVIFYLDTVVTDTDSLETILDLPGETFIFTRSGRIQPEDFAMARSKGRVLSKVHPPGLSLRNFELYRLD